MSETIDDGGPAFPTAQGNEWADPRGMSLRDYFAGQIIGPLTVSSLGRGSLSDADIEAIARATYKIADAMLAARKAKP